jgi:hypothetical protein
MQLHVSAYGDSEEFGELSVEMELRERSDAAEPLQREVTVQVGIDIVEHLAESDAIFLNGRCSQRNVSLAIDSLLAGNLQSLADVADRKPRGALPRTSRPDVE